MASISWNEGLPRSNSQLSDLGPTWRSFKTAVRTGLETAFNWTGSSETGRPSFATLPLTARAYYGARSVVSFPNRSSTLMVVSDESRLVAFGSANSTVVGSRRAVYGYYNGRSYDTNGSMRVVIDSGYTVLGGNGNYRVPFNATFSAYSKTGVHVQVTSFGTYGNISWLYGVTSVASSSFSVQAIHAAGGAPTNATIYWRAAAKTSQITI